MFNTSIAAPESVGIPSSALLKLMQRLNDLEYINSIKILRNGKAILEAYVKPYSKDEPHQLFSLSKSFVSCAIGIAQSEKLLSIHDKLISFFPEYREFVTDSRMLDVTLQDLLTMRSGHLACATKYFRQGLDWRKNFLSSELESTPGTEFTYNSGATYMLAAVIKKITGLNVREYLMPRLFEPMSINPGIWECCPEGINCGGWGLYMTTGDLAKFAQLLLQKGLWNGKQLVPADYLAEATRKHADNSKNIPPDWKLGYGYQFWISQHGYRGDGAAGQYVIILPEHDIAIAMTSCIGYMQDILTAIWEELIPALSDKALPEDAESCRKLNDFCSNLALPCTPGDITLRGKNTSWSFAENPQQIKSCQITFGDDSCSLTFDGPHGIEQLRAGFGFFIKNTIRLTDLAAHPTIASAAWKDDHTLEIRSFITDGIYRDIWTVDFNDAAEPLKNTMLCSCFRPERPKFVLK